MTSWSQELENDQKINFFDEEAKTLLGDDLAVKFVNKNLVLLDLILHLFTAYFALSAENYLVFCLIDLPLLFVDFLILMDQYKNGKIINKNRPKMHKIYRYVLITSISVTLLLLLKQIFNIFNESSSFWSEYLHIVIYFMTAINEYQLFRMNQKILFMTIELTKKESPEEQDL